MGISLINRLNDHLKKWENYRHDWGVYDCCLFVANFVDQEINIDIAKDLRGKYNSASTAYRALRELNAYNPCTIVDQYLEPLKGLTRIGYPVDILSEKGIRPLGLSLGENEGAYVFDEKGLTKVSRHVIIKGWSLNGKSS